MKGHRSISRQLQNPKRAGNQFCRSLNYKQEVAKVSGSFLFVAFVNKHLRLVGRYLGGLLLGVVGCSAFSSLSDIGSFDQISDPRPQSSVPLLANMTMEGITGMALAPGSAALSSSAFSRQRWQQAIVLKTFPHSLPLHAFQSVLVGPANAQTWRQRGRRGGTCYVPARAVLANDSPSAGANSDLVVPDKSVSVILLAGGKGKRMGANMPKQYLPLLGQPIALYSFFTFAGMAEVKEVVVVCDPSYRDIFEEAGKDITVTLKFALPGKERQDSVESGLKEISPGSRLACVHDSARPLVLTSDIKKVLGDAFIHGAAVLGVPVKATIKEATEKQFVAKTLDRRTLWEMHTPQVIEPSLLRRGFELVKEKSLEVTDDVSIVECLNHPVYITQGSYTNLKVTTPDDLIVAERILHGERSKVAAR